MKTLLFLGLLFTSLSASSRCEEDYIPPHTNEELIQVSAWSAGGAFAFYAKYAGVEFDNEAYRNDCPNQAIFNFGLATGLSCIKVDVTTGYSSYSYALRNDYAKDPESFPEVYMERAIERGMDKYIVKFTD